MYFTCTFIFNVHVLLQVHVYTCITETTREYSRLSKVHVPEECIVHSIKKWNGARLYTTAVKETVR